MGRRRVAARRRGWLVRAVLAAGLLAATCLRVDLHEVWQRLLALDPRPLALGALIGLPQLALCALRWRFTALRLGLVLGYARALREYALSIALNQALPLGVLGDGLRVLRHGRSLRGRGAAPLAGATASIGPALRAVVLERSAGQLVVGLWAFAVAPRWFGAAAWPAACALLLAACVAPLLVRVAAQRGVPGAAHTLEGLRTLLYDAGRALVHGRALPVQLLLSSAIVLTLVAQLACALSAVRVGLSWSDAVRVFPWMLLSMTVPIAIAGFGPREAATATMFQAAGLAGSDGAAFALAYGAVALLSVLPGLCYLALHGRCTRVQST